jgi:hypothetical protein
MVSLVWMDGTDFHPERVYPVATYVPAKICAHEQEVVERPESRAVD